MKGAGTRYSEFEKALALAWNCTQPEARRRCRTLMMLVARFTVMSGSLKIGSLGMFYLLDPEPKPTPSALPTGEELSPTLVQPLSKLRFRSTPTLNRLLSQIRTALQTTSSPCSIDITDLSRSTSLPTKRTRSAQPSSRTKTTH